MGIHQIFAHNLRKKCERYVSIADACNHIEVNRQQFNKYLSGAMLPNARTLNRLCKVLEIEEWELFVPEHSKISAADDGSNDVGQTDTSMLARLLSKDNICNEFLQKGFAASIRPGMYVCYFPMPGIRGCVVGSMVSVNMKDGILMFTRHTRLSSPSAQQNWIAFGKHRGFVLSNGTFDYMFGYNTISPNNFSLMCFPKDVTGGAGLLTGLAIIQGLNPLVACRTVMKAVGSKLSERKEAHRMAPTISMCSTDGERMIAKILHAPGQQSSAQLSTLDLDTLSLSMDSMLSKVELLQQH
jgi:transcriptional regulator with XRE-family HTH domain